MKKLTIFLILLFAIPCLGAEKQVARLNTAVVGGGGGASCTTKAESYESIVGATTDIGYVSGSVWGGGEIGIAASRTVCAVALYLQKLGTGQDITLYLYNADGTPDPSTAVGTCATITAANIPAGPGWVTFSCTADISLSVSTPNYFIVAKAGGTSTSNYIPWFRDNTGSPSPSHIDISADGTTWVNESTTRSSTYILYVR